MLQGGISGGISGGMLEESMWRPAHGATTRPGPCRPASGYGRAVGRPAPRADAPVEPDPSGERSLDPTMFVAPSVPFENEVDAPAVTP
jgi:hypothetical protein